MLTPLQGPGRPAFTSKIFNNTYIGISRITLLAITLGIVAIGCVVAPVAAQESRPISLAEAVALARVDHPEVRAAGARAGAARSEVRAVAGTRWPQLGAEVGVLRSDDPVAAFGARLRQGRFTQADFDPSRLNDPGALTDWDAALTLGWRPVDFSRDAAVSAARADAEAAEQAADWRSRLAGYQAEVRYVEAVGAEHLLEAARDALDAAEAALDRVTRREAEGLVTRADVLQVAAALENARADLISSEQSLEDARARLGLALGMDPGVEPIPTTDALELTARPPQSEDGGVRSDLVASALRVEAAEGAVRGADRTRWPSLQGFARLETHGTDPMVPDEGSWTVGLRVTVLLFTGFQTSARRAAARAALDATEAEHAQRVREARVALAEVRGGAEAARRGAIAAEAASTSAAEAARLMRQRYDEGLATTAELLGAEAAASRFAAGSIGALLQHRIVVARLLLLDDARLEDTPLDDARLETDLPEGDKR